MNDPSPPYPTPYLLLSEQRPSRSMCGTAQNHPPPNQRHPSGKMMDLCQWKLTQCKVDNVAEASSVGEAASSQLPNSNVAVDLSSLPGQLEQRTSATFVANAVTMHVTAFRSNEDGAEAKHMCTTCTATWTTNLPHQHHFFHLPPAMNISQKTDCGADEPARRGPINTVS